MNKFFLSLILFSLFCIVSSANAWSYPVKQVTWHYCEQTWELCTIDLPHIIWADYLTYQDSQLYRRIYSVMWGWTYYNWWDFWFGSHQWVDIASTIGTPITAIWTWEVVEASDKWDWGKTIVIKHMIWWSPLWSVYAHLDEITVNYWDQVNEGDLIGKIGETGNTTGPHVHFQIDTSEGKHPYFPSNCEWSITEIVNEGRCWAKIKDNTLDPILFLETNWNIFLAEHKATDSTSNSISLTTKDLNYNLENSVVKQWWNTHLEITPKTYLNDNFLKEDIYVIASDGITLSPNKISYIWSWRQITFVGKGAWLQNVTLKTNNSNLKKYNILVLNDSMIDILQKKFKNNPSIQKILNNL